MADSFGFPPDKRNGPTLPINVFSPKKSHVGIAAAEEPAELVVGSPLRIGFPLGDRLMLLCGDGDFRAVDDLRPVRLRQNRLVKPPQLQREVVESAEEDVGGDATVADHLKDLGGFGLSHRAIQQGNQGLVLRGVLDALLRSLVALLATQTLFNDFAPSVACSFRIPFPQVGFTHHSCHFREHSPHQPRVENALGLLGILGLEAGVLGFSLGFVHKVEEA